MPKWQSITRNPINQSMPILIRSHTKMLLDCHRLSIKIVRKTDNQSIIYHKKLHHRLVIYFNINWLSIGINRYWFHRFNTLGKCDVLHLLHLIKCWYFEHTFWISVTSHQRTTLFPGLSRCLSTKKPEDLLASPLSAFDMIMSSNAPEQI